MSYDWGKATDGPVQADKIPAGQNIPVTIERVIFGKKGGAAFKSKKGDAQIMVIFTDDQDNEAGAMFTLSAKAGWTLARLLKCFGANTEELGSLGIEPEHFAQQTIANKYLVGLSGRINLSWTEDGKYADVEPCERAEPAASGAALKKAMSSPEGYTPIEEADIPF